MRFKRRKRAKARPESFIVVCASSLHRGLMVETAAGVRADLIVTPDNSERLMGTLPSRVYFELGAAPMDRLLSTALSRLRTPEARLEYIHVA